jgi:uncharacterized surface protein with fasciclin (FAS1) repeats
MRCSSFHRALLGAAILLPVASVSHADECPVAAAQKAKAHAQAQSQAQVHTVAFNPGSKDIVDTAVGAGSFKTLVAAVQAAGLVETLKGPGPFTVFAPTDEAFAKLPPGQLEALLRPENKDQLVKILTNHVVPGKALEENDLKRTRSAKTVSGEDVKIELVRGRVRVDGARVSGDFNAANGVVVAIDSVLLPN